MYIHICTYSAAAASAAAIKEAKLDEAQRPATVRAIEETVCDSTAQGTHFGTYKCIMCHEQVRDTLHLVCISFRDSIV